MVGPRGAGKSTWARQHAARHPDRRYVVLGTEALVERIAAAHAPRKRRLGDAPRDPEALAASALRHLLRRAPAVRANYIVDEPNLRARGRADLAKRFAEARFHFHLRAVVAVCPVEVA
jgi:heterogeneous nuclear ribonucleoprotein U-like protein 1